jgi:hypothetical protein
MARRKRNDVKDIYLNDFHHERSERVKKQLSVQPKASLADAMEQYERLKRGSSRNRGSKDPKPNR